MKNTKGYALPKEQINMVISNYIKLGREVDIWSAVIKGNEIMGNGNRFGSVVEATEYFSAAIMDAGLVR